LFFYFAAPSSHTAQMKKRHELFTGMPESLKRGLYFSLFLAMIEVGSGAIKTGRYLGGCWSWIFSINYLNFDLEVVLENRLEML
jgi:hypothetical protein